MQEEAAKAEAKREAAKQLLTSVLAANAAQIERKAAVLANERAEDAAIVAYVRAKDMREQVGTHLPL